MRGHFPQWEDHFQGIKPKLLTARQVEKFGVWVWFFGYFLTLAILNHM